MKKTILFLPVFLILLTAVKFSLSAPLNYFTLGFDAQNLLTWKFTQNIGLFPYKDVFYPYGLLSYYEDANIFLWAINLSVVFVLFLFSLSLIKKIFTNKLLAYYFFAGFYFLLIFFVGIEAFVRYGVLAIYSLHIAPYFYYNKFLSLKKMLALGVITGIVFSLLFDQGVYIFIVSFSFIILSPLIKFGFKELKKGSYYIQSLNCLFSYFLGFFTGSMILISYLMFNGLVVNFFYSMIEMRDLFFYAKTPYLHSLRSFPSAFNFIVLFFTISYLSVRHILLKIKFSISDYILFSLVIVFLILDQKSIIRSIDSQILFVSFIIVSVFINILLSSKCFRKFRINNSFAFMLLVFFYLSLIVYVFTNNLPGTKFLGTFETYDKTLTLFKENNDLKKYYLVLEKIKEDERWNQKIFTYPSDPIFYIINIQKPPYYFTSYEASPSYAQHKNINYINENKINYIVYNLKNHSIQDGVPNYIRTSLLHEYIFKNFSPMVQMGDFLILSRQHR